MSKKRVEDDFLIKLSFFANYKFTSNYKEVFLIDSFSLFPCFEYLDCLKLDINKI